LEALSNWKQSTGKPLKNRARLGHVIWPSEEQRRIIGELGVAIEICPTCHRKVNWSKPNQKHPILQIYDSLEQPVVSGTDDSLLFGSSAKEELKALSLLFNPTSQPTIADLSQHQKQFRFF
jgi:adenosine deaminase